MVGVEVVIVPALLMTFSITVRLAVAILQLATPVRAITSISVPLPMLTPPYNEGSKLCVVLLMILMSFTKNSYIVLDSPVLAKNVMASPAQISLLAPTEEVSVKLGFGVIAIAIGAESPLQPAGAEDKG